MMRKLFLLAWLMIPVLAAAYHFGPGQEKLELVEISDLLQQAKSLADQENWEAASEKYDEALLRLPADKQTEMWQIRLERNKAWLLSKKLPEANADLKSLVTEISEATQSNPKKVDPQLLKEARSVLANSQYYLTWLMRLEGQPRDVWEPEVEAARQNYRLLADDAKSNSQPGEQSETLKQHQEDLEATIRLARMDLKDLQGLPLPSQCNCCNSGKCRGSKQAKQGKKPGKGQEKSDNRKAGSGPPRDGSGS